MSKKQVIIYDTLMGIGLSILTILSIYIMFRIGINL